MLTNLMIAGFGGQGVLFTGKIIALSGLLEEKEVSWLPSYGPEMRGGTANCSVCVDDEPIGCPVVLEPDILIAMNEPSFDKFIGKVTPGGCAVYDSALIHPEGTREDIRCRPIPATALATQHQLDGFSNIILLGYTLQSVPFTSYETLCQAVKSAVPESKKHLLAPNLEALKLGYEYQA